MPLGMQALALDVPRMAPAVRGASPAHVRARTARQVRRLEVRRIRRHFERALAVLRARDVRGLDEAARAARAGHIARLEAYALRGRFPKNRDFPRAQVPYFIDADGTRCAMAHLIDESGGKDLVLRVAASANHALVPELAGDAALVAWLQREGITLEEAALIQPAYCSTHAQDCLCSGFLGTAEGIVEAVNVGDLSVRVTAVHGEVDVAVDDVLTVSPFQPKALQVGDGVLVDPGGTYVFYPLTADGQSVDTSSCFSMNGNVPPTAPKEAAIASIVGPYRTCGEGLDASWNEVNGEGCGGFGGGGEGGAGGSGPGLVGGAGGGGAAGGAGGQGGGGAGAPISESEDDGCSVVGAGAGGGSLGVLLASAAIAGALQLRMRRYRPRR
jgi:hypothetical protein